MNLFITGSNGYIGGNFIKKAAKEALKFLLLQEKKNKKIKNVTWLVGSIDKNWHELAKSDVLVHFATVGATKKCRYQGGI